MPCAAECPSAAAHARLRLLCGLHSVLQAEHPVFAGVKLELLPPGSCKYNQRKQQRSDSTLPLLF